MTMEILSNLEPIGDKTVVTIGMFDGVHLGHEKVIRAHAEYARESGLKPVLLTFHPHPLDIVHPERAPFRLTTDEEKLDLFEALGVETVFRIPFSLNLSRKSPETFLRENVLDRLGALAIVVGHDHGFGRDRAGGVDFLHEMSKTIGFKLTVIEPYKVDGTIVTSTKIRIALASGKVSAANRMFGRAYELTGRVEGGHGRGALIGFPTANIRIPDQKKLIPADGVYAVRLQSQEKLHNGMLNIGFRPRIALILPFALSNPSMVLEAVFSSPMILTKIRACFMSRLSETLVIVIKPIRGSRMSLRKISLTSRLTISWSL